MSESVRPREESPAAPPPGHCYRCKLPMQRGTLVQHWESSWQSVTWRSDDATLMQRLFRLNRLDVIAVRCPGCGLVELYAPGES